MREKSCKELIRGQWKGRLADLKEIDHLLRSTEEGDYDKGMELFDSFGLSFTYDADNDCFVWLIGTGGPHDEIRFHVSHTWALKKVEYVYKDWFDGAKINVSIKGKRNVVRALWESNFLMDGDGIEFLQMKIRESQGDLGGC